MYKPLKICLIYSFPLCTLLPQSTFSMSQNTVAGNTTNIEELVVFSRLREDQLAEIPVSVLSINASELENASGSHFSDLEQTVPSLNFGRGGRKTRGEIAIRGIGDYSRNIGNDARVIVYMDGVPYLRSSTFNFALQDIAQIEIIRGPQGTFFGTNAVGGVINARSNAPSDEFESNLSLTLGDYNLQRANITANLPVNSAFKARISAGQNQRDGFIENTTLGKTLQNEDSQAARANFLITPNNKTSISINFDWSDENSDATNGLALADDGFFNGYSQSPGVREVAHDTEEYESRSTWGNALNVSFTTDAGYQWIFINGYRDNSFENLNEEDYSAIPAVTTFFNEDSQQLSQEIRVVSPMFERTDFIIGVFNLDLEVNTARYAQSAGSFARTPGTINTKSQSVYAHINYRLHDQWEASLGARYVNENKDIDYQIIDEIGQFTNGSLLDEEKASKFLPSLGLKYSPEGTYYFNVSQSYKSGGWNADFVASMDDLKVKAENAINWELGYKNTYFDERVFFNMAIFEIAIEDLQIFQFVDEGAFPLLKLTNAGKGTSKGFELDLNYQITSNLAFAFNTAYTNAKFDSFKNGGGIGVDYDNNTLPYAPEWKHYFALNYQSANVYGSLNVSHSDGYFSHPNNTDAFTVPSYSTVNAKLGTHFSNNWEMSVWATNLSDSENLRYRDLSFVGVPRGYYEAPRMLGLTLKYQNQ